MRPGDIVENERLGAVLRAVQATKVKRDEARLASPKMTIAQKERFRVTRRAIFGHEPPSPAPKKRHGRPPKHSGPVRAPTEWCSSSSTGP